MPPEPEAIDRVIAAPSFDKVLGVMKPGTPIAAKTIAPTLVSLDTRSKRLGDGVVRVDLDGYVHGDLASVLKRIDPQNWDDRLGRMFAETTVVDANDNPLLPPASNSAWSGVMKEAADLKLGNFTWNRVDNRLAITSTPNPAPSVAHRWDYQLISSKNLYLFPFGTYSKGEDVNNGFIAVHATVDPNVWRVTGRKDLRFATESWLMNKLLNFGSPWIAKNQLEKMVRTLFPPHVA